MLSIQSLSSGNAAAKYYQTVAEYYQGDSEALLWQGKGAKLLGLTEWVDKEQFKALLNGKLPTGQQLGRIQQGEIKHRPGFDMTFSAPKSVSLLALLPGGDDRLIAIHDKAVKETLALFEEEFSQTRVCHEGEIFYEKTGNLTMATLREITSREEDPNLHTHSIVMNVTCSSDGKFRALASDMNGVEGTYENAWHYRNYFGAAYRALLAKEVLKLGYEIETTHEDGRFEIKGVSQEAITQFSKRRQQIEQWLEEKGASGAKAAQQATLSTRKNKSESSLTDLHQRWQQEAEGINFNVKAIKEDANISLKPANVSLLDRFSQWLAKENQEVKIGRTTEDFRLFNELIEGLDKKPMITWKQSVQKWLFPAEQKGTRKALDFAIEHLSEREAVFSDADLRKTLLAFDMGNVLPQELPALLKEAQMSQK